MGLTFHAAVVDVVSPRIMPVCVCLCPPEEEEPVVTLTGVPSRIMRVVWGPLNQTIVAACEDGLLRMWDSEVRSGDLMRSDASFVQSGVDG